jgi:hypothetical protein
MPWDNPVRPRLDSITPSHLDAVCVEVFARLEQPRMLAHFRVLGGQLLVARDGTHDFSSTAMQCQNCLRRPRSTGHTLSSHAAIPPVMVCPGQSPGIAWPPEDVMPPDGHGKQDGARAAGTRGLHTHAEQGSPHDVTVLGDALSSNPPFGALVWPHGCHCSVTCQPDSHAPLSERRAFWQASDAVAKYEARPCNGRVTAVQMARYINAVLRRSGDEARSVNWCELTARNATTGAQLSHHSWRTNHRLTADNVLAVAQSGQGRWKIAHANTHGLKTKG